MPEMILALVRSLGTLSRRRVWWLVLSPAVAALAVWLTLTFLVLDQLSAWFLEQPPMSWLSGWGAVWLAKLLAAAGGWLVILAFSYLTAMVLAAVFIMPILLQIVAARDYPEVAAMGKDSFFAGAWNSVWAALLFIAGWLLTRARIISGIRASYFLCHRGHRDHRELTLRFTGRRVSNHPCPARQ